MKFLHPLAAVVSFALAPALLFADTKIFDGGPSGTGNAWGTAANWVGDSLPATSDDVVFDNSAFTFPAALPSPLYLAGNGMANTVTFGSSSGAPFGAFSLLTTATPSNRMLTLGAGILTVDSTVTGAITLGNAANGILTLSTSGSGYSFVNNSDSQVFNVTTAFNEHDKSLTFTDAGGGIVFDVQQVYAATADRRFSSLSGGASTTVITNNGGTARILRLSAASGSANFSGKIQDGTSALGLTKINAGIQILSGTNTYSGTTTVSGGVLRANDGTALPTASALTLSGGVLEASGTFGRSAGTGAGQLNWTSGGFSAYGGELTVDIGNDGASNLVVGSTLPTSLTFGSTVSNNKVVFVDNINLNAALTVNVNDNAGTIADYTEWSGVITGASQLTKLSAGTLYLSNNGNASATASLRIAAGIVRATSNAGSIFGGLLNFDGGSAAIPSILETSGSFTRSVGNGAGQVSFNNASFSGFSAIGGDLTVNFGGVGASYSIPNNAGAFVFGSAAADHTVILENAVNLGAVSGSLTGQFNVLKGQSATAPEGRITGIISGARPFLKSGGGTLELTAANAFTGTATVSAGTLLVSAGHINTSAGVVLDGEGATLKYTSETALTKNVSFGAGGGRLLYNSSAAYTGADITAGTGATMGGSGVLGSGLTIASGGTLSPGATGPGKLTTGAQTWAGGGTYHFEINNATGTEGVNWDLVEIASGGLSLTATDESPFIIDLHGLTPLNAAGSVANFDLSSNYSWTIATGTGLSALDLGIFYLVTTNFVNNNPVNGTFNLELNDGALSLIYTAIPEPQIAVLLLGTAGMLLVRRNRRRRA